MGRSQTKQDAATDVVDCLCPLFHTSLFETAEVMLLQGVEGPACSLVPLAGPSIATSTGLKWNLSACPLTEAAVLQQGACLL
jgi:Thiamin pyrophosphokinase, vitamin B1 binding domain